MGEREALLRAIRESPADDSPRLVYADWLDEAGETARAEFVRIQIELARRRDFTSPTPPSPVADFAKWTTAQLAEREMGSLGTHGEAWRNEYPALGTLNGDFERGFVESFIIEGAELGFQVRHAIVFFHATPGRTLVLRDLDELTVENINEFIDDNLFASIESLVIGPRTYLVGEALLALTSRPDRMLYLRRLFLQNCSVLTAPLSGSLAPRFLSQLTHLGLIGAHLNDRDLADLARLDFGTLLELDVSDNYIDDDGLIALVNSPQVGNLRSLRLADNVFGAVGVGALAKSPLMGRLVGLDVSSCENVDARAARAMLNCPTLSRMRQIELSDTSVPARLRDRLAEAIGKPVPPTTDDLDAPPDGLARYLPCERLTNDSTPLLVALAFFAGWAVARASSFLFSPGQPNSPLFVALITPACALFAILVASYFQGDWQRRTEGRSRWAAAAALAALASVASAVWGASWFSGAMIATLVIAIEPLVLSTRPAEVVRWYLIGRIGAAPRWAVAAIAGVAMISIKLKPEWYESHVWVVTYIAFRGGLVPALDWFIRRTSAGSFETFYSESRNTRFLDAVVPAAVSGTFLTLMVLPRVPDHPWSGVFLGMWAGSAIAFGAAYIWGNPSPHARRSTAVDAACARRSRDCRWPCLAVVVACLVLLWCIP